MHRDAVKRERERERERMQIRERLCLREMMLRVRETEMQKKIEGDFPLSPCLALIFLGSFL